MPCRDLNIDQLKAELQRRQLAMDEMNHRFRNQLQIISNLLDIQASQSKSREVIDALRQCRTRVASIVMVQDMLKPGACVATVQLDQYLPTLVAAVASAWRVACAWAVTVAAATLRPAVMASTA